MRPINSTASLVEWLRKQPAEERYNYGSICDCCLAQYFRAVAGDDGARVGGDYYLLSDRVLRHLPDEWDTLSLDTPWTYGAALARAEAVLAKEEAGAR